MPGGGAAMSMSTSRPTRATTGVFTLALVLAGCSRAGGPPIPDASPDAAADAPDPIADAAADAPDLIADAAAGAPDPTAAEWERVKARYGRLLAVAGKGASDSLGEWRPEFEGGPATQAELARPHFAMADDAGNLYIVDKESHGVRKVTPDGTIVTVAGTNLGGRGEDAPGPARERALNNPNGLFVLPDGTFYILDLGNGRVCKVTPDGTMRTLFDVVGGLGLGRGLWVAADESEAFVTTGFVIKRWTPSGGVEDWATGFSGLGNIARDRQGRLLVSDRDGDKVFALTAVPGQPPTRTLLAGDPTGPAPADGLPALTARLNGVRAVWPAHPDDGEGFFLGTHEGCQVWFVDSAGRLRRFLDGARTAHAGDGEHFATPGAKVSEIRSVALDRAGNVIVVENDRGFVRRVERITR
jgi:hypothetical protein